MKMCFSVLHPANHNVRVWHASIRWYTYTNVPQSPYMCFKCDRGVGVLPVQSELIWRVQLDGMRIVLCHTKTTRSSRLEKGKQGIRVSRRQIIICSWLTKLTKKHFLQISSKFWIQNLQEILKKCPCTMVSLAASNIRPDVNVLFVQECLRLRRQ